MANESVVVQSRLERHIKLRIGRIAATQREFSRLHAKIVQHTGSVALLRSFSLTLRSSEVNAEAN